MNPTLKRRVCLAVAVVAIALLLLCEIFDPAALFRESLGEKVANGIVLTLTRALGGVAFLAMLINLGYRVLDPFKKPFFKGLLISLPAFVIAINNCPYSQLIKGGARITEEWWVAVLLFIECLSVGFFEEMAFRGVVFLSLLKRKPGSRSWAALSVVISSVIFGLVHMINLFESSPGAVFLQIGYSALIGAMCSVVLVKTANIWLCVLIHGIYNFAGAFVSRCAEGVLLDTFTVVFTVVVSIAVAVYMVVIFFTDKGKTVAAVYPDK
jgi:membrane protease YdiL (CAAX protease family)